MKKTIQDGRQDKRREPTTAACEGVSNPVARVEVSALSETVPSNCPRFHRFLGSEET